MTESFGTVVSVYAALIFHHGIGVAITAPTTSVVHFGSEPSVFLAVEGASNSNIKGVAFDAPGVGWKGPRTFRPFVLFDESAHANVSSSSFTGLGWDWHSSYGLTWEAGSTGRLANSTVTGAFIGFYCEHVSGLAVKNNKVLSSHLYGIDPHTNSTHLTISGNTAEHNAAHGIILAQDVTNSVVSSNTSDSNGENGIEMYQNSSYNLVSNNTTVGNRGDGIVLVNGSDNTRLIGNTVEHNRIGILQEASDPMGTISQNHIDNNALSAKGITISPSTNSVDLTDTGLILAPLSAWGWIFKWLLWPLLGLFVASIFLMRRRELAAGWRQAFAERDADVGRHSWKELRDGSKEALAAQVKERDRAYPIGPPTVLPFEGPPS